MDLVVIGMPYEADGSEGRAAPVPAGYRRNWQPRDSTASCRTRPGPAGTPRTRSGRLGKTSRNAKEAVDMIAASLILRDYLDHPAELTFLAGLPRLTLHPWPSSPP